MSRLFAALLYNRYMSWKSLYHHPSLPALLLLIGVFLSVLGCLWFGFLPSQGWRFVIAVVVIVALFYQRFLLLGVGLGLLAIAFNTLAPYSQSFQHCHLQAVISQADYSRLNKRDSRNSSRETRLRAKSIDCDGISLPAQTVLVYDRQAQLLPYRQHTVRLYADTLQPLRSRLNVDSFDRERYWLGQGVRLQAKNIRITDAALLSPWSDSTLLYLRKRLADAITTALPAEQAAISLALVIGNRSALSAKQKNMLQDTGTAHLLAISGLHLSLLGGVAWLLGQALWAMSHNLSDRVMPIQAGAVAAFVAISAYAFVSGFDIPVKRAWLMFSLLIFSWLWQRALTASSLLLAAAAVLLLDPYALLSVGFYFSFIATFIVLWSLRLPYSPLGQIVAMQGLVNLTLLPVTWLAFGTLPLSAFFINLLVIPWLGLTVLPQLIVAALVALVFPELAAPLWWIVEHSIAALWQVVAFFDGLPLTIRPTFRPPLIAVISVVAAVLLAMITRRLVWLIMAAAGFCAMFLAVLPLPTTTPPTLIVADERYRSVLLHNGRQAFIIDPGRRYHRSNNAAKWQRYLHKHRLQLAAIILSGDKLSTMSSTHWLSKHFPDAEIITLKPMSLPYQHHYCGSVSLENLQLLSELKDGCQARLNWFGQNIFIADGTVADNRAQMLLSHSGLQWNGQVYLADELGAISIQYRHGDFVLSALRHTARLWRLPVNKSGMPTDN